jgi:hypothetical protein
VVHPIVRLEIPKSNPDHLGIAAFGCGPQAALWKIWSGSCPASASPSRIRPAAPLLPHLPVRTHLSRSTVVFNGFLSSGFDIRKLKQGICEEGTT